MKIQDIIILILIFLMLTNEPKQNFNRPLLAYEAEVAYKVIDRDLSQDSEVIPTPICSCNGTGRIKSGDGIIDIPCPCGDKCKCGNKLPDNTITISDFPHRYMFTMKSCSYCETFKHNDIPVLLNANWVIGYDKLANRENFVVIDIDKNPEIYNLYKEEDDLLPFFVVIKNKKKVDSKHGYMNATTFADWSNNAVRNK